MTEEQVIKLLKCLSDKSRLQIVKNLVKEPMYVELLAERLDLTPPTVSFHLKKLMDSGLVTSEKEQYYMIYRVNREVFGNTLEELILSKATETEAEMEREINYRNKIINSFFEREKLKSIPVQKEKRKIILSELADNFEYKREYKEKEVNLILADFNDDFCTLRKYMVEEGLFERINGSYKRKEK
jgi:ArsR family transcriptional regulator, arsenate/arsenite/antimonite-responsive transcriptional repressor